jgi:hypothetical protein
MKGVNTSPVASVITKGLSIGSLGTDVQKKSANKRFSTDGQHQALRAAFTKRQLGADHWPVFFNAYGVSSLSELTWKQADHAIQRLNGGELGGYLSEMAYLQKRVQREGLTANDVTQLAGRAWVDYCARMGWPVDVDTMNCRDNWTDDQWRAYKTGSSAAAPVDEPNTFTPVMKGLRQRLEQQRRELTDAERDAIYERLQAGATQ